MEFAVIGGDRRTAALAELLLRDGHAVRCYGLERGEDPALPHAGSLREALEGARAVILPLPMGGGEELNAPLAAFPIPVRALAEAIPRDALVLAGKPEGVFAEAAKARGLRVADYFAREELTVKNAAVTVEGAVEILMRELPVTLLGARVLVVGFGRIGKLLALRLHLLGARVTVSARKPEDWAWIECLGLERADTRRLAGAVRGFDAVVNTVPAPVLGRELLAELDKSCFVLDLASRPGGVDLAAARELGLRAEWALGLPGKAAPETAGAAIRDTIYHMWKELECSQWKG